MRVHAEINPIIVAIDLLPYCRDSARVGKSPNLLGVAIAPTCPFNVEIIAFFSEIFSMWCIAYFHFIDSARMLNGIKIMAPKRKIQCFVVLLVRCWRRRVYSSYVMSL